MALVGALPRTPGYLNKGEGCGRKWNRAYGLCYRVAMPNPSRHHLSRLHSKRAEDAAWRAKQAHVDADIEGLARDADLSRFVADMKAAGVPVGERIKRLKAHVVARQRDRKPAVA